jgi:NAD(P)-dependent dehydrogenase (short-subunit alcohol dehydrogenase family)
MGEGFFDLTGKVAIITGSSRGIGRGIAERMAEQGAKVVISSRKAPACEEVAAAINAKTPGRAAAIPASLSSKVDLERLVEETRNTFGAIDIPVCNAATSAYFGPSLGISDEAFRKMLDNNIMANHWLIQLVAPDMQARKDGAIILISSVGGMRGSDILGAYSITKAADMQMARNYARELGPSNIRVNTIAPGIIRTDFAAAFFSDPASIKRMVQNCPLRRVGEADDIAGVAVFLASKAGAYTTGQTIVVDGGGSA